MSLLGVNKIKQHKKINANFKHSREQNFILYWAVLFIQNIHYSVAAATMSYPDESLLEKCILLQTTDLIQITYFKLSTSSVIHQINQIW